MNKRLLFTLMGFFISIIIGCLYVSIEGFEDSEPYCILLTTCVNRKNATPEKTKELLEIYTNAIDKWLQTDLPIIVIDSSDYVFKEYKNTRLKVCHFMCKETTSSSTSEAFSISYAINNCNHTRKYKNIIKITGRYFIEDFSSIMKKMGDNSDLYIQHINNPVIKWQHSEVFGFNKRYADEIFKPVIENGITMEHRLWEVSHSNYTVVTFQKMPNVLKVTRGGDGLLVDPL
jgi:hypothetical protein